MPRAKPDLDAFFAKQDRWRAELTALRAILHDTALVEEMKWGKPCYTYDGANVVILYALKDTAALGFFKGVLIPDPQGIMLAPGANSQSSRWLKVADMADIAARHDTLSGYINAAIAVKQARLKVAFPEKTALVYPPELAGDPELAQAFNALTPGRRRVYNLLFAGASQSASRKTRIAEHKDRILAGKGLHDR